MCTTLPAPSPLLKIPHRGMGNGKNESIQVAINLGFFWKSISTTRFLVEEIRTLPNAINLLKKLKLSMSVKYDLEHMDMDTEYGI